MESVSEFYRGSAKALRETKTLSCTDGVIRGRPKLGLAFKEIKDPFYYKANL